MSYVDSSRYEGIQGFELRVEEALDQLNKAKEALKEAQRLRNLDLLYRVGDKTVIRFTKSWNGETIYHYAAIKTLGTWSITGQASATRYIKYTPDLISFIGDGDVTIMTPDKTL